MINRMPDEFEYDAVYEEVEVAPTDCEIEVPRSDADDPFQDFNARQFLPLSEQSLSDFEWFFEGCEGLTYVFVCKNRIHSLSPTLMDAILLVDAARFGSKLVSPYGWGEARPRSPDIPALVKERVQEMVRRETEFVLIWDFLDEGLVHVDASPTFTEGDYLREIADYLAEELRDYLVTW